MAKLTGWPAQNRDAQWSDIQPISAEIFGLERFKQHALSLAESQTISLQPRPVISIIKRLDDNATALTGAYRAICAAVARGKAVTPAAEWLIDNYHLVEEQVRQTRSDLPAGFYRQLPKLATGPLAGHPRIFGLVWAYVAHTDSLFDPDMLTAFVNEYQQVQPLTTGELWAVAISLRLILIENLRRSSQRIIAALRGREAADAIADRALALEGSAAGLADVFSSPNEPAVSQPFAVQLIQRLREQTGLAAETLVWLKQKTDAQGYSFETAVNDEHHRQSTTNITVRNIITSLRLVSDVNWENWFDSVSLVDRLLRQEPGYGEMDFPSRTLYRTTVEELARGSGLSELDVAQRALDQAATTGEAADPGYHLFGPGRATFEATLNFKPPFRRRIRNGFRSWGLPGYLGFIAVLTGAFLLVGIATLADGGASWSLIVALIALALLPVSEAALAVVNFTVTHLTAATVMPGLALRNGVPADLRTLVAVPSLLTSFDDIEELIDRLEVHYLSNADGELYFALVTDWTDAPTERTTSDGALLNAALDGISRLNSRYGGDRFLLLHRARAWNPQQDRWMGWERKRGKLHELNRLLRGDKDTTFMVVGGRLPDYFRSVLTLDADTKLPRDAARRLVGKLAHRLNQPRFDPALGRVTSGHGVLQPRVTASLPAGHPGTLFQWIFSSPRGIDPYVFAVSDVYQDLFGEGSFAGKGIYDIDAFEAALAGKVPENTLLSHDLFEGIFARAALVTDIEVVEEYPERYNVAAARQHRWVRGDWQLLPWLLGRHNAADIPALGQWKMIDNLRRSLVPLTALAALLLGWSLLPLLPAILWSVFVVMTGALPPLLPALSSVIPRKRPFTIESRIRSALTDLAHAGSLAAINLLLLGHQAGLMADAVGRSLYRLYVSRQNLLEWTTAAQAGAGSLPGLTGIYRLMAISVAAGMAAIAIAGFRGDGFWWLTLPFAIAWLAAPAFCYWISRPVRRSDELEASPQDRQALRRIARRTWRFFEAFVTAPDNHLPPDNFQEDPAPEVAHRTSPTNIGLYLLSTASAREFGWIGLADATSRLEATLATLARMEKYRGHLYIWYDTQTLIPLEPKYVSTVDSGNLAGHLIAVANSCAAWMAEDVARVDGIEDVLDILTEDIAALPGGDRTKKPWRKKFDSEAKALRQSIGKARAAPEYRSVRLIEIAVQATKIRATVGALAEGMPGPTVTALSFWAEALCETVEGQFNDASAGPEALSGQHRRLGDLIATLRQMALAMEFGFLLDPQRLLLSIGYRVPQSMRDENCYDMLASEARLASFFAIAKGDLRTRHWFRLGRSVTGLKGGAALVSWSGSMFEYLMPSLVMRAPGTGLLDQTTRLIVQRQISYAKALGIPWGISESAFNARDVAFTYQYSNFGVPGLGLKRGLAGNAVIAPYATGLAAMVAPRAAAANYDRLAQAGGRGDFGFYEALDYTPARLRTGENVAVVKAYFAHHQGMTIVAILNAVKDGDMRTRFHAEPMIRATELLLQERAPRNVPLTYAREEEAIGTVLRDETPVTARSADPRRSALPAIHLLSNGKYSVMITAAGGGVSSWNGLALTRWREDPVCDDWGAFIYLRDLRAGKLWSAGHTPVRAPADSYLASFSEDKVEITRHDGNIKTTLECIVSPEDNAEARRVTIVNSALTAKDIEVTSYAELVLAPANADMAHPAFSKMFVVTEFVPELETLLATRRRRSPTDPEVWLAHFMVVQGNPSGEIEFETDRARFIGAGNSARLPAAMTGETPLSQSVGTVLDPIFALRRRLKIPAGRQARCTFWTVADSSREAVLDLVDRYRQTAAWDRAQMLAWTQAQIHLRHLAINPEDAHHFQTLAGHLIYANAALRAPAPVLMADMGSQAALWPAGISGDRPILLLRIDAIEDIALVQELIRAFGYWTEKQLAVDLVILNDRMSSYVQDLQLAIEALVRQAGAQREPGSGGQIFTVRADLLPPDTLRTLPAVARVVLSARRGKLASQLSRLREPAGAPPPASEALRLAPAVNPFATQRPQLEFDNGFGGFGENGREYVSILSARKPTPAPWINVIANPAFGFHSAADGGGYTWFGNSRENKITQWSNDPAENRQSEVFYVSDGNGFLMSPTLMPLKSSEGSHSARHGFGYSVFAREARQLRLELLQLAPLADAVKISRLRLTNTGATARNVTVTFYVEWVLGVTRASSAPFVTTEMDAETSAMFARNRWNLQTGNDVAFADISGRQTAWTADRREFLGTNGTLASPQALATGYTLSNRTGAGLDPCCALQTSVSLKPGQTADVVFLLGAAANATDARELIARSRTLSPDAVLADVTRYWDETLNAVQVRTPDRSLDIMLNGWLLYQTLACRMWARSGFYQASGAYGFRDQLQDSMALLTTRPAIAREHILRAAARQFIEGDVQHWWLPATGMGVRTRISDDTAWLGYCVCQYITVTGDQAILDETVPFLEGQTVAPGDHDAFFQPVQSAENASLYEHCARAIERNLPGGSHGLPLIGTGDWNDGMNRVGEDGKGESVWLGWFLYAVLQVLIPIASQRGDTARVALWGEKSISLKAALEQHGWDGAWYRRGFYDDGAPLGSAGNPECRIDAIAQSWAVISGAAAPDRALAAMEQSWHQLVRPQDKLMALFTPPFDRSPRDPGYIKAYPPGIRENGGQYTHGVLWSIFAHARLGEAERAFQLFSLLNPINHAKTPEGVQIYRVEPYVIAADVYSTEPHTGRGGWTWYTGSGAWMYRAGLEAILGITREGNRLRIKPCIPAEWSEYEVAVQFGATRYDILISRTAKADTLMPEVQYLSPEEFAIDLKDSGGARRIVLTLGSGKRNQRAA